MLPTQATWFVPRLDDFTMAALSGTSSRHAGAHGLDCARPWGCAGSMARRAGALADGHATGALALAGGPLGGAMVPQLAAPSPFHRAARAGGGPRWGVVRCGHGSGSWHASDRDGVRRIPTGAVACLVAWRNRFHRRRAGGTASATTARAAQLL